jgi:drug/metabolite transporter (DMT)-like permease
MVMFIWSFKLGGKISTTFPAYATTFIWGTILGVFLDKESFNWIQGMGVALVVVGISVIASFGRP